MKKVLVLTASFGDGHNAAAKGIRESLEVRDDFEVTLADLYAKAVPLVDRSVQFGYTVAINRMPWAWDLIFRALDHPGLMERMLWTAGALRRAMEAELEQFKPDAVISTYPLYGYLFREIQRSQPDLKTPMITVITDSVGVNSAWYRCRSDAFLVPDEETAEGLEKAGVERKQVHALGFPVSRRFSLQEPVPESAGAPWKLLFLPSTQLVRTMRQITALLALPEVELTILAGRHGRLQRALQDAGLEADGRCTVLGWTDKMPELLASHHAFIGKAGGAIVQEAIASRCPFFVSHVVPGQEEGNIALIERLGVGTPATGRPRELASRVEAAFGDDAKVWRGWKKNLGSLRREAAADRVADFVAELVD
ncbi:MAG: hypothetical protein WA771_00285 [Chthoniobacterales bacterium]